MIDRWESYEWLQGLRLLSLDFITPFYPQLGINVESIALLKSLARGALEKSKTPGATHDLAAFFRMQLSPKDYALLTHWIKFVHCIERTKNPWFLYHDLFLALTYQKNDDSCEFQTKLSEQVRINMRNVYEDDTLIEMVERAKTEPLSNWDRPLFLEFGLADIIEGPGKYYPFVDDIVLTAVMAKLQNYWKWVRPLLSASDVEFIAGKAMQLAAKSTFTLFTHPDELPLALT